MFKLENGKEIDWQKVIQAMEDRNSSNSYFLDTKTGKVIKLPKSKANHFIQIPKISDQKLYLWMKEYTDEFIKTGDPDLAKKVYKVLKQKNVFEEYERTLEEESDDGEIHGWAQSKHNYLYEEMQDWLFNLHIGITEHWEYDNDCAMCQEMKKADEENRDLTESELKKAFAKAKKEGTIVGGVEEDKSKSIN